MNGRRWHGRWAMVGAVVAGCASHPAAELAPIAPVPIEPAPPQPPTVAEGTPAPEPEMTLTEHGVGVIELRPGSGRSAAPGDTLEVHYVGRLEDGTEFDSSRDRGAPFRFELGGGMVIDGWEEGLAGMKVGELRRIIVPPSMGYGARGAGPIPPEAILEFEVELISLAP